MKKNLLSLILILTLVFSTGVYAANVSTGIPGDSLFEPLDNGNSAPVGGGTTGTNTSAPVGSEGNGLSAPVGGGVGQPSSGVGASVPASSNSRLSVAGIATWFIGLLNYAVQVIIALALIAFLYGVFRLVFLDANNATEREKARKFMIWGISALFVMVSVWGLVNVLKTTVFGGGALIVPQFGR